MTATPRRAQSGTCFGRRLFLDGADFTAFGCIMRVEFLSSPKYVSHTLVKTISGIQQNSNGISDSCPYVAAPKTRHRRIVVPFRSTALFPIRREASGNSVPRSRGRRATLRTTTTFARASAMLVHAARQHRCRGNEQRRRLQIIPDVNSERPSNRV
jgi:hypothetical protein